MSVADMVGSFSGRPATTAVRTFGRFRAAICLWDRDFSVLRP